MLIIDDEPYITVILSRFFGQEEIVTANDGAAALEILGSRGDFDVVLCDLNMPEIDGIDIYGWLRAHRPNLSERIIFLSGGAYDARMISFTANTTQPIVDKPFTFEELIGLVKRIARPSQVAVQG
ncbi:MAG: response regulator [Myxococcota bacterium]